MNPFEIRAELLKLAQEHVEAQYKANVEFATKAYELMVAQGKNIADITFPTPYTFEDVMEKAKEMYSFVDGKCSKWTFYQY